MKLFISDQSLKTCCVALFEKLSYVLEGWLGISYPRYYGVSRTVEMIKNQFT